jgi:hypothetical protein
VLCYDMLYLTVHRPKSSMGVGRRDCGAAGGAFPRGGGAVGKGAEGGVASWWWMERMVMYSVV